VNEQEVDGRRTPESWMNKSQGPQEVFSNLSMEMESLGRNWIKIKLQYIYK